MAGLLLLSTVLFTPAQVPASPSAGPAPATVVWEFERRLQSWPRGQERQRDQAIRAFFAGLRDRATRLEAIGMTDNRYVYAVPREMVSELMGRMLRDPDLAVRIRAAHSLGYNGLAGDHPEAIVALLRVVPATGLHEVIYAMGRSRDPRFLPHLRALLKHPDGMVRGDVVFQLTGWPPEQVLADVMALWDDPHQQVRYNLLSWANVTTPEGLARTVPRLKDPSPFVRAGALQHLALSKDPEVPQKVAGMLDDPDPEVRARAAEALGTLKAREHSAAVVRRFRDPKENLYVRRMAIQAFEKLDDVRHLSQVRELLRDPDDQLRGHAARIAAALEKRPPCGDR